MSTALNIEVISASSVTIRDPQYLKRRVIRVYHIFIPYSSHTCMMTDKK